MEARGWQLLSKITQSKPQCGNSGVLSTTLVPLHHVKESCQASPSIAFSGIKLPVKLVFTHAILQCSDSKFEG